MCASDPPDCCISKIKQHRSRICKLFITSQIVNILGFSGLTISVTPTLLLLNKSSHGWYVNDPVRLCSNKPFTKTGGEARFAPQGTMCQSLICITVCKRELCCQRFRSLNTALLFKNKLSEKPTHYELNTGTRRLYFPKLMKSIIVEDFVFVYPS